MKKYFALLLALVLGLSLLTACGGKQPPADSNGGSSSSSDGQTPSSGSSFDGVFTVGVFQPLTGPSSLMGTAGNDAVILAAEEINAAGGICGKEVVVVSYDDKSSPEEAVKSVNKMLEVDKVDAIVGSLHSGNIQACGDIVEEAQIPLMGTGTSPQWLQKGWTYLFRPTLSTYYSSLSAIQACEALDAHTIAIFYSQDEYGKNGKDNMVALCEEYNLEVVTTESMKPGDSDFTAQCSNIAAANPDVCYIIATTDNLPPMVKQSRANGIDCYIIGEQSLGAPEVKDVARAAADGVVYGACFVMPQSDPSEAGIPALVDFFQAYLDRFGKMCASEVAVRCYDGMYLLKAAAEKAGSTDGTAIRDALYTITDYAGLQGTFDFSIGAGEGLTESRLYIIDGGKDILLDEYLNK